MIKGKNISKILKNVEYVRKVENTENIRRYWQCEKHLEMWRIVKNVKKVEYGWKRWKMSENLTISSMPEK